MKRRPKRLQRAGKPVYLAANKVDNDRTEAEAAALWSLGLGEPHPISAMHGRGVADLLDLVTEDLPEVSEVRGGPGGPRRVALVGKPNVGKSSLLNRLAGDERSVVHDVAGTTVDPVDSLIELGGKLGVSSTPPGCGARWARPAVMSSTRRCARTAPSMPPRWSWC